MFTQTADTEIVDSLLRETPRHSWSQTMAWHLLPGVPLGLAYAVLAWWFERRLGLPNVYALFAVVTFIELPLLWALLRRFQRDSEKRVLSDPRLMPLRQHQPWWVWVAVGVPVAVLSLGANMMLVAAIDESVRMRMFAFLPDWYVLDFSAPFTSGIRDSAPAVFFAFYTLSLVGFIAGSWLQELYFRGVLLPRMPAAGIATPVANAALFSLFHLTSPWALMGRLVFLVPWSLFAWWRRSTNLGIVMHVGMAVLGAILGALFMFAG